MKGTKLTAKIWVPVVLLALAALACGGGTAEPTATALRRATQRPEATATEEPEPTEAPTRAPTRTPRPTATEEEVIEPPFVLSAEPYLHPSGAFSIQLPEGWEVQEYSSSVYLKSPDEVVAIEVAFTNVGKEFDEETLTTFIQAVEQNWFAGFADYESIDHEPQADGSILVYKTLTINDVPQSVWSYYWQEGNIIYSQDFWVDEDQYDVYVDALVEVANSMETDPAAGVDADLYDISYKFTGPSELFEIYVPYGWTYETEVDDVSTVDTFWSPDGLSFIENITYDDGEVVSRSLAGAFALTLLKDYYNLDDIRVTDDEVQPDGSERLTWFSASGGFDGVSFFETRGTTFLLLSWVVSSDFYDLYLPVWNSVVDTYTTP